MEENNNNNIKMGLNVNQNEDLLNSSAATMKNDTIKLIYPEMDVILTSPYYLSITGLACLGNIFILSVILGNQRFRKPANYLVANYSLSSLLFTISTNLRLLENSSDLWPYSTAVCQVLVVLHRIPIPMVALTTMIISLDRGRVARNPVNRVSILSPVWKIIAIWGFSVVIVMPLALTREVDKWKPTPYKCIKVRVFDSSMISLIYGIGYLLSVHIIPAIILIEESVKTRSKMKFLRMSSGTPVQGELQPIVDGRLKMLRNSCIFTVIFLTVWLPYGIFQFPMDLPKVILPDFFGAYIKFYFKFFRDLTYIQICFNPVILFVLSYDLKGCLPCVC